LVKISHLLAGPSGASLDEYLMNKSGGRRANGPAHGRRPMEGRHAHQA
jgi:hypothetical protein